MATQNVALRIPTPTFGAGLIEAIDDDTILANLQANAATKLSMGIRGKPNMTGRPNVSGNDGTITRFGWKAQNKSLELFSGEAYNVEQGVTSDLFPQERDEARGCKFNSTPESPTHFDALNPLEVPSDVVNVRGLHATARASDAHPRQCVNCERSKAIRRYRLCSMPYPHAAYWKVFSRRFAGERGESIF